MVAGGIVGRDLPDLHRDRLCPQPRDARVEADAGWRLRWWERRGERTWAGRWPPSEAWVPTARPARPGPPPSPQAVRWSAPGELMAGDWSWEPQPVAAVLGAGPGWPPLRPGSSVHLAPLSPESLTEAHSVGRQTEVQGKTGTQLGVVRESKAQSAIPRRPTKDPPLPPCLHVTAV